MMRVAAIITLAAAMYSAASLAGLLQTSRAADAETDDGVRMPLNSESPSIDGEYGELLVEVMRGDHMWNISARHLDEVDPGAELPPYWRRVVEANTARIRSGDPDLIYPGEKILLPALTGPP